MQVSVARQQIAIFKFIFKSSVSHSRGAFAVIKKCYRLEDKDKKLYAAKFVKYDDEALKILKREVAMIQKWEHEKFIYLFEVYIVRKYVVLIMEWCVHFVFVFNIICMSILNVYPQKFLSSPLEKSSILNDLIRWS